MKDKKSLFIYIAAYLAILIPSPGRFVFGVAIMFELFLLVIIGTLMNSFVKKIKMDELNTIIIMLVLICFSILYRQILVILYPEIALVLGFVLYLPPVSLFLVGYIFTEMDQTIGERLKSNSQNVLVFIICGLLFFLFRDIAGYGTFTFFGQNHQIYEKVLLNSDIVGIFTFFASIPGSMILAGIILFTHICIRNKFQILKNSEVQNDVL